jgi:hypothetical protein
VITLVATVAALALQVVSGTVGSILNSILNIQPIIALVEEALGLLLSQGLVAGLVNALLATPLAVLTTLTTLTDALASSGCNCGGSMCFLFFFSFSFPHYSFPTLSFFHCS